MGALARYGSRIEGTEAMNSMHATGQKDPDRLDESLFQTGGDRCPTCSEPIAAIIARAPDCFEIRPCGHDAGPVLVRDAASRTARERECLIADGGWFSKRGEPTVECQQCGAKYHGERAAHGCCLIVRGGES